MSQELDSSDGENSLQETWGVKLCGKMNQEAIDATICNYMAQGWSAIGSPNGLGFISPSGDWINYIDPETGKKTHFNRKWAERLGFYVSNVQQKEILSKEVQVSE